jgi:hypothetical protein
MTNSERAERDKLWAAVKRDYFAAVETVAGVRSDRDDRRWNRLLANWRALCSLDTDRAATLAHGFHEVYMLFDIDLRGPAVDESEQLTEVHDALRAMPNADEEPFRTMYALGEEALQRHIDEDQPLL